MSFPQTRLRRLRQNSTLRSMIQESHVSIDDLIMPLFIVEGSNIKKPITSMPGNYQMSIDNILKETEELWHLGVKSVLLFGIPAKKMSTDMWPARIPALCQRPLGPLRSNVRKCS